MGCAPVVEPPPVAVPAKQSQDVGASSVAESIPAGLNSPQHQQNRQKHLATLLRLIRERLELMPQVAQAKWNRKSPITDPKRESLLLDAIQAKGEMRGLSPEFVRAFFQAQITASKLIQEQLTDEWTRTHQAPFPNPPDLEREIRPRIDALNEQLLEALGRLDLSERSGTGWNDDLEQAAKSIFNSGNWSPDVIKTALGPLR